MKFIHKALHQRNLKLIILAFIAFVALGLPDGLIVITSYSIHYTKLYDPVLSYKNLVQ